VVARWPPHRDETFTFWRSNDSPAVAGEPSR
jgi:hypothetical protein